MLRRRSRSSKGGQSGRTLNRDKPAQTLVKDDMMKDNQFSFEERKLTIESLRDEVVHESKPYFECCVIDDDSMGCCSRHFQWDI
jgi:hypothetical protein